MAKLTFSNTPIWVITSCHIKDWKDLPKRCIDTFLNYWPKSISCRLYFHDGSLPKDAPKNSRISYQDLLQDQELLNYLTEQKENNGTQPYRWEIDAIKWSYKVFALTGYAQKLQEKQTKGWLIWLDADIITKKTIPLETLHSWLPEESDIAHLERPAMRYSETSFIGFNLSRPFAYPFLSKLRKTYLSGEFQNYAQWHDGYIFEQLLKNYKTYGLKAHNLSVKNLKTGNAFKTSELNNYMTHFKGISLYTIP